MRGETRMEVPGGYPDPVGTAFQPPRLTPGGAADRFPIDPMPMTLDQLAQRLGATLVTTEKDFVRFSQISAD